MNLKGNAPNQQKRNLNPALQHQFFQVHSDAGLRGVLTDILMLFRLFNQLKKVNNVI